MIRKMELRYLHSLKFKHTASATIVSIIFLIPVINAFRE